MTTKAQNMQTFNQNTRYVCDDKNAKYAITSKICSHLNRTHHSFVTKQMQNTKTIRQNRPHVCDKTNAAKHTNPAHKTIVTTQIHKARLRQHKCNLYKQLSRTHCTFVTTQMQNM